MGKYEMVVLIVFLVVMAGVIKHYFDSKMNQDDERTRKDIDKQDQKLDEIDKRLKVIESIITSDGYDLKQRFKDLDQDS